MSGPSGKPARTIDGHERPSPRVRRRNLIVDRDCSAGEALRELASDEPNAIEEGRLFLGKRRILLDGEPVQRGDLLTLQAARPVDTERHASKLLIARREGLVAAAKPAAWSTEPDRTGTLTSLREQLAKELGLIELHIGTRLDVGVSGLVLGAIRPAARRHLANLVGTTGCHRSYVAVVAGAAPDAGRWDSSVDAEPSRDPAPAITRFECVGRLSVDPGARVGDKTEYSALSLLVLRPETGRRHQLRIHCSRAGFPVMGDRRYGGPARFVDARGGVHRIERILLHAFSTSVVLPSGAPWNPTCAIPEDFERVWATLGGNRADFAEVRP